MDRRREAHDFLISRRARLKPEHVGLPAGSHRRVDGLRRSEVAALARLSVECYTKIERGDLGGVSDQVLDAIARALRLDDAERVHLAHLARPVDGAGSVSRRARRSAPERVNRPSLQWALDAVTAGPAFVRNGRMDLLAVNQMARAFYAGVQRPQPTGEHRPVQVPHTGRPRLPPDWDTTAGICVAILRAEAGRDPRDRASHDLVGELSTRSHEFSARWGQRDVRHHGLGRKRFNHPIVGEMTLAYEGLEMIAEPGLVLTIYSAQPGTASAERLQLLGSWAATSNDLPTSSAPDHAPTTMTQTDVT